MRPLADWLERQQRIHPSTIDLDLARVRAVAQRLGLTKPSYPVITVGGTNGKGSTVAYFDALFRAAGWKCGRFTSPHLTRYNERICVGGVEATDAQLIESFERIDDARGEITLTFFEYNALAALDHFDRSGVDVAVLEVGLGGRLDATNLIDGEVAVVCSIGLDHTDWLGNSLDQIAREKAGIFRAGRPAVLGTATMPAAMFDSIERIGARAIVPGRHFQVERHSSSWNFQFGDVVLRDLPYPRLSGAHQVDNAAAALAAIVAGSFPLTLDRELVGRALADAFVRGRFQVVPGEVEWVLDVAHNPPAAQTLAENLSALQRAGRTIAVCGILGDKDVHGITEALRGEVDAWVLAALEGPRALSIADLAARLPSGVDVIATAPSVARACELAREAARPGDRIVVFGSFLTVGPALEFLGI